MRHIKYRRGTKKWKRQHHKSKEWYTEMYGTSGIAEYMRNGKR